MTTYYVDVAVGNDANAGTSEGSGNAWASYAKARATAVAGDIIYVKASGTYTAQDGTNGCVVYITTAGTAASGIFWYGYTSTPGDGGKVTVNATTGGLTSCLINAAAAGLTYNIFHNHIFTGGSGDAVNLTTTGDGFTFYNCEFNSAGGLGCQADDSNTFILCTFANNTGAAFDGDNDNVFIACKAHGNGGGNTINNQSTPIMLFNVLYDNGANTNLRASGGGAVFVGNVVDGDNTVGSVGMEFVTTTPSVVMNNILFDLGTGLKASSVNDSITATFTNLFYSNTTDRSNVTAGPDDVSGTADPFTNSGTRDYSIGTGSEAYNAGTGPEDL